MAQTADMLSAPYTPPPPCGRKINRDTRWWSVPHSSYETFIHVYCLHRLAAIACFNPQNARRICRSRHSSIALP